MKLLRRVIVENRRTLMYINNKVYVLHLQLSKMLRPDLWQTLDGMSYNRSKSIEVSTKEKHRKKLDNLKQKSTTNNHAYPLGRKTKRVIAHSTNNVVNLSSQQVSENAIQVLSRGLNFAPAPLKIPVESIITSVEDTIIKNRIPHQDAECIRQDISSLLRKCKPPKSNMNKEETQALKDLRNNQNILVLPADKGNASVIVDTEEYERRIEELVSDDHTYKKVSYNPTSRVTNKVLKLLHNSGSKDVLDRLRPHNPTSPKMYGLPKIHKTDWPLRPIVSQIDAPTYKMSRHMASILQPLVGKTKSNVKNSRHFVQLLDGVQVESTEIMVSFDVSSLFTSVPIEQTVDLITTLIQRNDLPDIYIEWARFCLTSGYFMWRGEHYLQINGVAMGSPVAPVAANIFMEWFEDLALSTATNGPRFWWRYVDDVFAIIHRDVLEGFTDHLQSIHKNIRLTVEEEKDGELAFLDVRVIRKQDGRLAHTVYRKPTHTDRYLRADSHHHQLHLSSVPRTLIDRALSLCDREHIEAELSHVKKVLVDNGYNWRQCTRWAGGSERKRTMTAERAPIYLPFVKGITDKIGYLLKRRYDIKTVFRPHSHLKQILRSPKDREPLCGPGVYKIPCDCGKSYIGETRRNVATRLSEHIRSIKNMETNKSALAAHALNEDSTHYIRFDKASVLAREKYFVPRKIREAMEISRHPNFNRDSGWTLPPAWKPILNAASKTVEPFFRERDTLGKVCENPIHLQNNSDDDAQSSSLEARALPAPAPAPPPPGSPPMSSRAERARARSLRAALLRGERDS